jgi:alpha-D-ribose 1-methylphosphonate 5-triphosphate synthase subunit PhnG
MASITNHLVTASANLSLLEILHAEPDVLLGVTSQAVTSLKTLDIQTVFDLASSRVFANASMLVDAGTDPRTVLARYGVAPADMIGSLPPGVSVDQLRFQTIDILEGIGPTNAPSVSTALHVTTVRDLALWPPYIAAREILGAVFFPDAIPGADPDAPADLLPKSGEYPTERVFYTTLVFDGFDGEVGELTALEQAEPVDLAQVAGPEFGFKRPGIGALLTMSQSWYAQGVALGQLLHSVALAPGESTRIAMLDWSRRTVGKQSEDVTETEAFSNVTEHSRALSEVTSAVAQEAQSGFSESHVASSSQQGGSGFGFGLGPITTGNTSSKAGSMSDAMSFSSSSGRRELSAAMTQNVVDRTQQQANATRNRRATVVREVSQEEHESVSTRVVTNYNHMHALSIQYYEVVQIYRVAVQLARIEKCLFLPMRLIDFKNAALVRMFRKTLADAAVDPDARTLLTTDFDTVQVKSPTGSKLVLNNPFGVPTESKDDGITLALPDEAKLHQITVFRSRGGFNDLPQLTAIIIRLRDGTFAEIERAASSSTTKDEMKVIQPVPLREIEAIFMTNPGAPNTAIDYSCSFSCSFKGRFFWVEPTFNLLPVHPVTVLTFTGGGIWDRLVAHLEANRLHYSQAVFRALDPATVTLLLSGYSYGGLPVTLLVDPQPVTTAGNYLVFKTHVQANHDGQEAAEREWAQWLDDHGVSLDHVKEDLVPLPSGGVFAEAVLGRYNSAEKLDITRFWNWQDSPIPIQAPEIAPVQLGSRAQSEDLKAGAFSQPLVNIVSPTSLPEPTGLGAALQAIANGNMFRDMSGLAATIGLAQAGLQTTSDAATAAGVQAGSNLATAAKKEVEMFKAALAFAGAVMGKGSPDTSPSTISNEGAKINHGRSLDSRGVASGGQSGGTVTPSGEGTSPVPSGTVADTGSMDGGRGSSEAAAFDRSLWGQSGEPQVGMLRDLLQPVSTSDITTLSDGSLDKQYVIIFGLRTTGTSLVINTPLGVNAGGHFNNAVEISAKNSLSGLQRDNPQLVRHTRFRWRQTVSEKGFQKIGNTWKQVYHSIGSLPDDPDPQLQQEQDIRGWIRMFDSPGWPSLVGPSTRMLDLGGGNKSDAQSVEVVVKMFLQTWVEGLNASGAWERVSEVFEWCSVQWLKRTNPNSDWQTTPNSKIVSGTGAMMEFAKSPDDIDI